MGKNDFLSPKAIANRIKSKGLQKLRWYCQMCQKQCRDENGFKCHLTSESHKRQMMVFGEAPDRVVQGFTEEFERTFMEHLRRSHPFSRVSAKVVYNEYIADRNHIHMNSTTWYTLTDFVKYLGKSGQCRVDETEKGWFISVIQPDPAEALAADRRGKRERAEKEEEERQADILAAQIARAQAAAATQPQDDAGPPNGGGELQRDENGSAEPVQIALGGASVKAGGSAPLVQAAAGRPKGFGGGGDEKAGASSGQQRAEAAGSGRKRSKLEELMEAEKASKRAKSERAAANAAASAAGSGGRQDAPWLLPGITVKVMSKALKEAGYYRKKGVVEKLAGRYIAQICMSDSGDVLQVDQAELETVLPAPGGAVVVVKGAKRGARGEMLEIDVDAYRARVALKDGGEKAWFEYEDICKAAAS